ncbi:PKD domain-containing protein [Methanolobus sediminis]|uniref:PKD domain-containing protein n=1 Tax=Methanolobus sediminis TaxID=3072978 RepID=A0AA51UJ24_9EURY|nr:PKD domain-containing protein [Methanolobus sediminis]WMW24503.1 PKD domain-containing protein [Methanolobus sediminis]
MDRRFFLPVIIMFLSVLLLAGLINFQTGYAQEVPDETPAPVIGDKETVVQDSPKTNVQDSEPINDGASKEVAPASTPTLLGMGGGGGTTDDDDKDGGSVVVSSVKLSAAIGANVTSGCAPLSVQFTDNSTGTIDKVYWDFDDNGANSSEADPAYTFVNPGIYVVNLTVSRDYDGVYSDSATLTITVDDCAEEEGDSEEEGGSEEKTPVTQEVPEFPTIAIPMIAIIGMAFIFSRRQ